MNQVPHAPEYPIKAVLKFFRKFAEILAAQSAPSTPVANGKKTSIRKVLNILFGHLWVVELKYR
jgi:hypothetical protein